MIRHAFIPCRCYAQDTGEIRKRGDTDINTLKYFDVEEAKLTDFISCPKYIKVCIVFKVDSLSLTLIFFTQKIFLDFQTFTLNLLRQKLSPASRILAIFLEIFKTSLNMVNSLNSVILSTVHVLGLHPNVPNEDGLLFMKKALD